MILAIDIGTSSIRAGLYDEKAEAKPRSSVKIESSFDTTPDGGAEIDADVLLDRVVTAIDAVLSKNKKADITHVSICAFWHSLLGMSANGRPTTKLLGWADTRSREYSSLLREKFDEKIVHNRTGAHFHSSFWSAKLLWLRREFPDIWKRTTKWLSFSDYLYLQLFDSEATSISMASATGIFDQRNCDWDGELLRFLKLKRAGLPKIVDCGTTLKLSRKFAKRWPQLTLAQWFPAVGDGLADHVGSCGFGKSRASLMVGTSAAMRIAYVGEPPKKIPDGLWCYRIDREKVIVGGALSDGGNLYELIKKRFNLPKNTDDLIRSRGASKDDLIVLPFFFGERSTGYNEDASGAIIGLKPTHDGIDVLQAAMEGVAFRLSDIHDRLKKVAKFKEIVASGGALRESPVWTQIIADTFGCDLTLSDTRESSSRGVVLLALESLGKIDFK